MVGLVGMCPSSGKTLCRTQREALLLGLSKCSRAVVEGSKPGWHCLPSCAGPDSGPLATFCSELPLKRAENLILLPQRVSPSLLKCPILLLPGKIQRQ